jgi:hypothetical protein
MIIKIPRLQDRIRQAGYFYKEICMDRYYLTGPFPYPLKELIRLGIWVRRAIKVMYTAKI